MSSIIDGPRNPSRAASQFPAGPSTANSYAAGSAARPKGPRSQRGMAVLLVLVILSISLALAYGVMRVQMSAEQVQSNSIRRGDARQAAQSAMSIAMRQMSLPTWVGVGQTISGSLSTTDRYEVSFATGDPDLLLKLDPAGTLTAATVTDAIVGSSSDAEEVLRYPYRVTVTAKGFSRNPGTGAEASHVLRAVFELMPQKMPDPPSNWTKVTETARNYAVYQRDDRKVPLHMPLQVRGNMRLHGELELNNDYPGWQSLGSRYLAGLVSINNSGTDHRPFIGQVFWKASRQSGTVNAWLRDSLGVARTDVADEFLGSWRASSPTTTYQLYPGGAAYNVTAVGTDIASDPDIRPLANPLRIMFQNGNTRLSSNANLRGTLVLNDADLTIDGNNIRVDAFDLPKLGGQAAAVRLPSIVAKNLRHAAGRSATITGMVSVDEEFKVDSGSQSTALDLTGIVVAKSLKVDGRTEWKNAAWGGLLAALDPLGVLQALGVLDALVPGAAQANYNAQHQPRIILRSDANLAAVAYHWHTAILNGTPLYQEKTTGSGLRWNTVSWKDNP
jgi:hypothetical protein